MAAAAGAQELGVKRVFSKTGLQLADLGVCIERLARDAHAAGDNLILPASEWGAACSDVVEADRIVAVRCGPARAAHR